jgi:hypothetical protein
LNSRRRERQPTPIIEHPDPLFIDWIEPGSFQELLAPHMRRHGDTYWGLWRALVRPDEVFDRTGRSSHEQLDPEADFKAHDPAA